MTPIAHRLGLYSIPLLASLALPVWAAGPVGLGYLKMGMNKSAIEQGDSSGAIKLLGPLQELKLPTKAPVADDYYTTQAVLPFSPDPVKLSLGFKGESLSVINIQLPDEAMENKIRAELEGKYGPPKLDDGRKDEQCIYRNGNSFTLKSGVMSVGWTDEETSTTTALNLVHFQSCPSSLSGDMVRTQPSRSLSIQRRPAPCQGQRTLLTALLPLGAAKAPFCSSAKHSRVRKAVELNSRL